MSCQINAFSSICDVRGIRKKLFPNWIATLEGKPEGDCVNYSWDLNDDEVEGDGSKDELSYFQQCHVALSPVGDVMVIAHTRIATFLTLKWDETVEGDAKGKFVASATEVLTDDEEDHVTCVLCLPLASQQKSLRGRTDWTAIIMGFTSGQVKMYTENGVLLISQKFHEEAVTKIKCRTFEHPRYRALAEQHEELVILYKKAVVTVDGFSLYQTLRACRNQAAKATASGNETIEAPPVAYKKWGFLATDVINDCESVGIAYSNLFDNMMYESISRGFHGFSRSVFPTASLFITTGQAPYLSFFYAVEGSAPSLAMDVAMAAAHKIKSLLTGLFGRSKVSADKKPPKIEPSTPLSSRFEIRDFTRLGLRISASPNRHLSVVTDDFGRVILIDNYEGITIRIWKGYRDAQCGWIEAEEDSRQVSESKTGCALPRNALFLVIYCPRRGILEIWAMQQGPRVAAFNVNKSASLVSCPHGILGLSNVKSVINGRAQTQHCYLVDSDGQVKTISVPFHYALSGRHSKRARDLHLLKKLKTILRSGDSSQDTLANEASGILLDIKTANVRKEALDTLVNHKNSSLLILKTSICRLLNSLQCQDPDSLDFESKLLLYCCVRQQQLLHMYEELQLLGKNSFSGSRQEVLDDRKPSQTMSAMFHLGEPEVELLLGHVDKFLAADQPTKCVRFKDKETLMPGKFLSCFQTYCSHLPRSVTTPSQAPSCSGNEEPGCLEILLEPQVNKELIRELARVLYRHAIQGNCCSTALEGILMQSGIDNKQLLILLMEFWLQMGKSHSDFHCLRNCYNIVKFLSSISGEVVAKYNELSPWWTTVRNILSSSTAPAAAFTASLICRGVAVAVATAHQAKAMEETMPGSETEKEMEKDEDLKMDVSLTKDSEKSSAMDVSISDVSISDWEDVDMDTVTWSLLVKQLEDLVMLSTLLTYKIPANLSTESRNTLPEYPPLTVSYLSEKGRGFISELVAIWMTRLNINVVLELNAHVAKDKSEDLHDTSNDNIENARIAFAERIQLNVDELKELVESIRQHFPRSLQRDVLLANCCREFGAIWNKEKDDVKNLQNAVMCLEQVSASPWGKGVASYLWHTFMKGTFRSAALLMEKVGKVPKERLCRKELCMSEVSLDKFVDCCVKLLDILLKVCSSRDSQSVLPFQCEEPWQNTFGPQPFVDIAAGEKEPGYDLVCHHYKLALSMQMVLVYGLKSSRPLGMYDTRGRTPFFSKLHSGIPVPAELLEPSVNSSRMQFLCKVITAAVLTLPEPSFDGSGSMAVITSEASTARHWIGKVMQLAALWGLDNDPLWRHYVCELYSSGLDSLAEEILPFVSDREVLASQLILLVGQRIYSAVNSSSDDYVQKIAMFPPTVTTWLSTLNMNSLRCPNPPLQMTVGMIAYIFNAIPEDQAVHKMAVSLLDPLNHLISSGRSVKQESS